MTGKTHDQGGQAEGCPASQDVDQIVVGGGHDNERRQRRVDAAEKACPASVGVSRELPAAPQRPGGVQGGHGGELVGDALQTAGGGAGGATPPPPGVEHREGVVEAATGQQARRGRGQQDETDEPEQGGGHQGGSPGAVPGGMAVAEPDQYGGCDEEVQRRIVVGESDRQDRDVLDEPVEGQLRVDVQGCLDAQERLAVALRLAGCASDGGTRQGVRGVEAAERDRFDPPPGQARRAPRSP